LQIASVVRKQINLLVIRKYKGKQDHLQIASDLKIFYFDIVAKQTRRSDCPINLALELFGDRWTLLIIRDLMFMGKRHYGEFLRSRERIATNILANRLALLEKEGIIIKHVDPAHKSKFIYKLSHKGIDLLPILVEVVLWSVKYDKCTEKVKELVDRAKRDREGFLNEISSQLKKELLN
jgi:DNA-binding HxlR family transcriptional regulator